MCTARPCLLEGGRGSRRHALRPLRATRSAPSCSHLLHAAQDCQQSATIDDWKPPSNGQPYPPITLCPGGKLTFKWNQRWVGGLVGGVPLGAAAKQQLDSDVAADV